VLAGCVVGSVTSPAWILGLLCLALGSGLHLWTKGVLEQNERLTTAGPYRWTRNPFYLANLLIDGGLCLVIGHWWLAAVYAGLWAWSYRETIAREEERLQELFGEEFTLYRAEVPRLLPAIHGLAEEKSEGCFRWSNPNLSRGREYARLLGVWLAPGAIWAAGCLRREGLGIFEVTHWLELGGILLLAAAWILKLALAETFRRPELALLPLSATAGVRGLIAIGLTIPMIVSGGLGRSAWASWVGGGLLLCLAAGMLPMVRIRLRILHESLSILAVTTFGIVTQTLWLASLPILWLGLSVLDRVGRARSEPRQVSRRVMWPSFPRIAVASGAGMLVIASLAFWTR
jgi:protein-S-isoprenylcysteine O-methyltransferase Ste14